MTTLNEALEKSGGALLAIGILAAGASGMKPGSANLAAALPAAETIMTIGILTAVFGGVLIGVSRFRRTRS